MSDNKKKLQAATQPQPSGAVAIRNDGREIQMTKAATEAMTEIQSAIMVALQFPRNEKAATDRLLEACRRVSFAEDVEYEYPRGKKKVESVDPDTGESVEQWIPNIINGPSVYLAREAARLWGNLRSGIAVVSEDVERRTIEAFAWDMETNRRESAQDIFEKKVQRKVGGTTQWVPADERELRELQNRRAAIAERNCILQVIPSDIISRATAEARETMRLHYAAQKDESTKKLIAKFAAINVTTDMICEFLGIPDLTKITPEHLVKLRPIFTSINEGNSRWSEYVAKETATKETAKATGPERATTTVDSMLGNMKAGAAEDNRGHGADNLQTVKNGTEKDVAKRAVSDATDEDASTAAGEDDRASGEASGSATPIVEEPPPMSPECVVLQHRIVVAKDGSLEAAERWLARASKATLPNVDPKDARDRRTFRSLTPLEARTITAALDDKELVL